MIIGFKRIRETRGNTKNDTRSRQYTDIPIRRGKTSNNWDAETEQRPKAQITNQQRHHLEAEDGNE